MLMIPILYSCNIKHNKNVVENENKTNKDTSNEIEAIILSTYGGRSTIISQTYIITKDSVHYTLLAHDTTKNKIRAYKNSQQNWKKLIDKVDLKNFEKIEDQESRQAYDGNDTKISIKTKDNQFKKMNAEKSPIWREIYKEIVETYYLQN